MARMTKEEKRIDTLVNRVAQNSMNGYRISIMDMHHLTDAGIAAAKAGKTDAEIESAVLAARDQYATKT